MFLVYGISCCRIYGDFGFKPRSKDTIGNNDNARRLSAPRVMSLLSRGLSATITDMTRLHYASTADPDMRYLLQYQNSDPFFFLEYAGERYVFLSALNIAAYTADPATTIPARPFEPINAASQSIESASRIGAVAIALLTTHEVTGPIAVPPQFPTVIADAVRSAGYELTVSSPWLPERMIKTESEIAAIATNTDIVGDAFNMIAKTLAASEIRDNELWYQGTPLSSERLKYETACFFLSHHLQLPEGLIIAGGEQGAMPHHTGSGVLHPHQPIVVDLFPQSEVNHHFADLTRTFVKGTPSAYVQRMYDAVAAAKTASLDALAPGKSCAELYEISATVIREHGFDIGTPGYNHALGHGLGIGLHEAPTLAARADTVLQAGHVITIEPSLYYPEHGGVRLEDTIVITDDSYRNLTHIDTDWIIA